MSSPRVLYIRTDHRDKDNFGGVGFYRSILPARLIGGDVIGKPTDSGGDFWTRKIKDYDVVVTKHIDAPMAVSQILGACADNNVPLLLDFDDDFTALDTPPTFNYPAGSIAQTSVQLLMEEATSLTVSTKPLLKAYDWLKKPIHLLPNFCDPSDWPHKPLGRKKDPRVVVGWTGSLSHVLEYDMVVEIALRLYEKYGDKIRFAFVGLFPPPIEKKLPRHAYSCHHGAGQWEGYPQILADQGIDIGIAPLKETTFNQARSAIKWMEYTLTGTPTVASDWGEYPNYKGLLLAKTPLDFVNQISKLIESPYERTKLLDASRANLPTSAPWREVLSSYKGHGFRTRSN